MKPRFQQQSGKGPSLWRNALSLFLIPVTTLAVVSLYMLQIWITVHSSYVAQNSQTCNQSFLLGESVITRISLRVSKCGYRVKHMPLRLKMRKQGSFFFPLHGALWEESQTKCQEMWNVFSLCTICSNRANDSRMWGVCIYVCVCVLFPCFNSREVYLRGAKTILYASIGRRVNTDSTTWITSRNCTSYFQKEKSETKNNFSLWVVSDRKVSWVNQLEGECITFPACNQVPEDEPSLQQSSFLTAHTPTLCINCHITMQKQ